jgi:hypothetical protein
MRTRVWRLATLALGLLLSLPRVAGATEDLPRVRIEVTAVLDTDEAARLESAIRAQLADVAELPKPDDVRAAQLVVRVARAGSGLVVTLVDEAHPSATRPRTIEGADEVSASTAGAIARAFVVAFGEQTALPVPVAKPSSVPVESRPAPMLPRDALPPNDRRGAFRVGALYTGTTFAPTLPWQSGARLEASLALGRFAYAGLGYAFHPGASVASPEATVRITRHSPGLFAGAETTFGALTLGADAGLGLDTTLRATTATSSAFAGTADTTVASASFAFRAHAKVRPTESHVFGFDLAPTLEVAPGGRTMVVAGATDALLAPASARFRLDVGGTFEGL